MRTFAARLRENGNKNKFIEKIEGKYKKQVPRKTIYREALILLFRIISVRNKLKI